MHRGEHQSGVLNFSADIFRSIIPIHADGIDRGIGVVVGVEELHDSGKVVGFARWFTDKVGMV